ncbi:MAG: precorrin-2 C(20)-methyltransferase [Candidatus Adiutrix sp.]|jgi:precorrin-2/cobalt-factor-2 C20-methyltransferase|nr:precorrin-2 C(20)-methyltransferase [Candidatus Adiutrix sp.]
MAEQIGTLYGIGVGPGDPELLTLKAARLLGEVDLVFAAASPGNDYSLAQNIAGPYLKPGIEVRRLEFPMVGDEETLTRAWKANAEEIIGVLRGGLSAAFLTLGDPLTYSTYGYVLPYLAEALPPEAVVSVPGVTSYQMAASRLNQPLVTGLESLAVMSGVEAPEKLGELLDIADNVAILKTYRNYENIIAMLKSRNLLKNAVLCSRIGLPDEEIRRDLDSEPPHKPPYLSLMIVKNGGAR